RLATRDPATADNICEARPRSPNQWARVSDLVRADEAASALGPSREARGGASLNPYQTEARCTCRQRHARGTKRHNVVATYLPTYFLHNVLVHKVKVVMLIAPGHSIHVQDQSDTEVTLAPRFTVAEFHKGRSYYTPSAQNKDNLQLLLNDPDACVIVGASHTTTENLVVNNQSQTFDEAKVLSQDMRQMPNPDNNAHFALVKNQDIDFILEPIPEAQDDDKAIVVDFAHGGSAAPATVWTDASLCITWSCRWAMRGRALHPATGNRGHCHDHSRPFSNQAWRPGWVRLSLRGRCQYLKLRA
ncbi:hypothetical protein N9L68_04935, partial [bacterium]|nr:hypothetical protein [bacterium]